MSKPLYEPIIMLKKIRATLYVLVCILFSSAVSAQDTVLVDIIRIPYSIKSVAADKDGFIYMSGAKGLEKFSNPGHREIIDPSIREAIYNEKGNIVPVSKTSTAFFDSILDFEGDSAWQHYLPFIAPQISIAQDYSGRYWIAAERFIYIFKIENRFKQTLKGKSIRGILYHQNHSFVQTYQGIFVDNKPLKGFPKGEGNFVFNHDGVYMASGSLFRLNAPNYKTIDSILVTKQGLHRNHPDFRGIICISKQNDTLWVGGHHVFGYFINGTLVNIVDTLSIDALAYFKGKAYFCLNNGPVFSYSKKDGLKKETSFPERAQTLQSLDSLLAIGTSYNGLFLFDGEKGRYIRKTDGLANDNCYHVLRDLNGNWWVSTMSGLTRFSPDWSLSETYLPSVEFNRRSYSDYDNILSFGSVNGIYSFNPSDFESLEKDSSIHSHHVIGWLFVIVIFLFLTVVLLALKLRQKNKVVPIVDHRAEERKMLLNATKNFVNGHTGPLTLAQLAEYMDYSERHLYRLFDDLGMKAGDVLREVKLEHVHNKLNAGDISLKQAAEEVGYTERYFKKIYDQFLEKRNGRS